MPSVAEHLRRATLFVLPSWQEGFGIAAAEALATGLPVDHARPGALVRDSGGGVLEGFSPRNSPRPSALLASARLEQMRRSSREYVEREHARALPGAARRRLRS